jgi:hypothetical protein
MLTVNFEIDSETTKCFLKFKLVFTLYNIWDNYIVNSWTNHEIVHDAKQLIKWFG